MTVHEGVSKGLPYRITTREGGITDTVPLPDPSPEQRVALDALIDWWKATKAGGKQLMTLGGFAGCGKSTTVANLAEILLPGVNIAFCAYTGKAASVLRRKLRSNGIIPNYCGTIHKLIYEPEDDGNGNVVTWKRVPSLDYDLLIVDEASMVDEPTYRDLASYGIPILAVGDHGQLPPVHGKFNLMECPVVRLETIHRQAEGNPILALSQRVRREGQLPRDILTSRDPRLRAVLGTKLPPSWFPTPGDAWDTAVLTYKNLTRQSFNGGIYRHLGEPVAKQVIILRNFKCGEFFFANGDRGILTPIGKEDRWKRLPVSINFPDHDLTLETLVFRPQMGMDRTIDDFEMVRALTGRTPGTWNDAGVFVDYGYAFTGHKSQGDQWRDVVIYTEPTQADPDTQRRWLYTTLTRASHNLKIVLNPRVLWRNHR